MRTVYNVQCLSSSMNIFFFLSVLSYLHASINMTNLISCSQLPHLAQRKVLNQHLALLNHCVVPWGGRWFAEQNYSLKCSSAINQSTECERHPKKHLPADLFRYTPMTSGFKQFILIREAMVKTCQGGSLSLLLADKGNAADINGGTHSWNTDHRTCHAARLVLIDLPTFLHTGYTSFVQCTDKAPDSRCRQRLFWLDWTLRFSATVWQPGRDI